MDKGKQSFSGGLKMKTKKQMYNELKQAQPVICRHLKMSDGKEHIEMIYKNALKLGFISMEVQ